MKKILSLLLAVTMVFSLSACRQSSAGGNGETAGVESNVEMGDGKVLVAYFSWADNAVLAGDVDAITSPSVVPPGDVQQLAGWVQEETGGRPVFHPGHGSLPPATGMPAWRGRTRSGVPMALLTFLEQNDLSGKNVYLFCSHGTGGTGRQRGADRGSRAGGRHLRQYL